MRAPESRGKDSLILLEFLHPPARKTTTLKKARTPRPLHQTKNYAFRKVWGVGGRGGLAQMLTKLLMILFFC